MKFDDKYENIDSLIWYQEINFIEQKAKNKEKKMIRNKSIEAHASKLIFVTKFSVIDNNERCSLCFHFPFSKIIYFFFLCCCLLLVAILLFYIFWLLRSRLHNAMKCVYRNRIQMHISWQSCSMWYLNRNNINFSMCFI